MLKIQLGTLTNLSAQLLALFLKSVLLLWSKEFGGWGPNTLWFIKQDPNSWYLPELISLRVSIWIRKAWPHLRPKNLEWGLRKRKNTWTLKTPEGQCFQKSVSNMSTRVFRTVVGRKRTKQVCGRWQRCFDELWCLSPGTLKLWPVCESSWMSIFVVKFY